ncbi:carbohydrate ABC transporter permease [Microbacterium sp. MAHUQ-60]|uniref:carbohydrate ABC transporter permease n=1 Tax=unclassified Microbacterium TaxID=2609290 RepID=UPI00361BC93E
MVAGPARRRPAAPSSWVRALPWLAPSLLGLIAFTLVPLLMLVWLSGTRWSLVGTAEWIGFSNVVRVATDERWWHAVGVTAALTALTVPMEIVIGIIVGYALSTKATTGGGGVTRAALLLPWMSAPLTAGVMMRWIFAPADGALSRISGARLDWLDSPLPALLVVMAVVIWQSAGFAALIYAISFADVPQELKDAAALDGCGELRTLIHVSLPSVRAMTVFLVLTGIVSTFGLYDVVIPLTAGGPLGATETVGMRIVSTAWEAFDFGAAAVMSLFALVIELVLIGAVLLVLCRRSS